MRVRALAPWYGSDRLIAEPIGRALDGCSWVGIPFAGGLSAVRYIPARTLVVNDLHRHVINMARVVADDQLRPKMIRTLRRKMFHPDELALAQERCRAREHDADGMPAFGVLSWAIDYFVCCWMNRSAVAGTANEFVGRPAIRWTSDGGDSSVRYWSALRALSEWGREFRRCTFETMDAFDFLARVEDREGHGLYVDPPFLRPGRRYKFNAGKTDAAEWAWHIRLRNALNRFSLATIVLRAYDVPELHELYPEESWTWQRLIGRKQTNDYAAELLLTRRMRSTMPLFD